MSIVPKDIATEQALLGSLLCDDMTWDAVAHIVKADHFSEPQNQAVYACIADLKAQKKATDPISVNESLKRRGQLESVVPSGYAFELSVAVGSTSSVEHYAQTVRELWALRERKRIALEILNDDAPGSVEEKLARDSSRLLAVEAGKAKRPRRAGAVILDRLEQLEKENLAGADDRKKKLVDTGLRGLDNFIMGMIPGEPVLIGARPSVGKSSLALAFLRFWGKSRMPSGVFWLEDGAESWSNRVISGESCIPSVLLRHGSSLRKEHWTSLMESMGDVGDWPMMFDDEHGLTAQQVAVKMRWMHREIGCRVFLADHLGEFRFDGTRWGDRHDLAMGDALKTYRDTAKDLGAVPVIMAQLGRDFEKHDREPKLSDIFGTGIAEQVVRTAIFLSRDGNKVTATFAKNTNGPTGPVELEWDPLTMTIRDPAPKPPEVRKPLSSVDKRPQKPFNPADIWAPEEDD